MIRLESLGGIAGKMARLDGRGAVHGQGAPWISPGPGRFAAPRAGW